MTSAIRATIPLLTAPLVDICDPSALDSLHVALMSTLSAHLLPSWDPARPALGAPLRTLHLSTAAAITAIPRPLARAATQVRINARDWVSLLLAHHRTRAMSISVDPGLVALQLEGSARPVIFWSDDLFSSSSSSSSSSSASSSSRSASPVSVRSSLEENRPSASDAEAPWNVRKSRLPSLVAASARQAQARANGHGSSSSAVSSAGSKLLIGSPRTPKSFATFAFPSSTSSPRLDLGWEAGVVEEEPSWMTSLLGAFPDAPVPSVPAAKSGASKRGMNASAPAYRPPHSRGQSLSTTTASSSPASVSRPVHGHVRTDSMDSWTSSHSSQSHSPSYVQAHAQKHQLLAQHLAANMSQLSISSTSSGAPSISHSLSSMSSTSSTSARSESEQAQFLAPVEFVDDGLPSPCSPTASAYAYVDYNARRTPVEYECGKVGVLGGAVMLGMPSSGGHRRGSSVGTTRA